MEIHMQQITRSLDWLYLPSFLCLGYYTNASACKMTKATLADWKLPCLRLEGTIFRIDIGHQSAVNILHADICAKTCRDPFSKSLEFRTKLWPALIVKAVNQSKIYLYLYLGTKRIRYFTLFLIMRHLYSINDTKTAHQCRFEWRTFLVFIYFF